MDPGPVAIPLKAKYLAPQGAKKTQYKPRTGPTCCNVNCPSGRKKGRSDKKVTRVPG